jgi:hypothetical protein
MIRKASETTTMSRAVTITVLSVALALATGNAAAGGDHYHHHGHYGPYGGGFHPGFGYGLGVRYSGVYYYAPPPVYYADPGACGWDAVRIWRHGTWRARRVWRCW